MRLPPYLSFGIAGAIGVAIGACTLLTPLSGFSNGSDEPSDATVDRDGDGDAAVGTGNDGGQEGGGLTDAPTPPARLYVFGGSLPTAPDTPVATVNYAGILADGSLGAWQSAAPLPQPRRYGRAVSVAGFVALTGGEGGGSYYATTALATVSAGTVGAWQTSSSLYPTPRIRHGAALHDGRIYVLGGTDVADKVLDDVEYAALTAAQLGPFTAAVSLPAARARIGVATSATWLYVIGGTDTAGSQKSDVYAAKFQLGGALDPFVKVGVLPTPRAYTRPVVYGSSLVIVGGEQANPIDDVVVFPILPTGALGAARATTPLPKALSHHEVLQYANRLYVVGGFDIAGNQVDDVFIGDLAADGSVTAWRSTTKLPTPLTYHDLAVF